MYCYFVDLNQLFNIVRAMLQQVAAEAVVYAMYETYATFFPRGYAHTYKQISVSVKSATAINSVCSACLRRSTGAVKHKLYKLVCVPSNGDPASLRCQSLFQHTVGISGPPRLKDSWHHECIATLPRDGHPARQQYFVQAYSRVWQ